jgi:hypothetical protein
MEGSMRRQKIARLLELCMQYIGGRRSGTPAGRSNADFDRRL